MGGGTIGLLMLQLSLLRGASKTAVIEPIHEKRAIARELLADEVFDPKEDQLVAQICDMTSGGADVVIECVGSVQAVELSLKLARRGGKAFQYGVVRAKAVHAAPARPHTASSGSFRFLCHIMSSVCLIASVAATRCMMA